MGVVIANRNNKSNSLQVSRIVAITPDENGIYNSMETFLIKNDTVGEDGYPIYVKVNILPEGQETWISTYLHPGWNPELCKAVEVLDQTSCCGDDSATCDLKAGW